MSSRHRRLSASSFGRSKEVRCLNLESLEARLLLVSPTWEFEGPAPLVNVFSGGALNLNPNNGTGAIEAIATHPTDANTVYVGSVNGGVWKTGTAHHINPTWSPLTDFQRSLSISSLAISPADINADGTSKGTSTGSTVYAGTGSFSSGGLASGDAIGVLRSVDGQKFKRLAGSRIFSRDNLKIRSIVPLNDFSAGGSRQRVLVAAVNEAGTKGGVYISDRAGENFRRASGNIPELPATHLVPDLSPAGILVNRVYAAVVSNSRHQGLAGIYRSQGANVGSAWTKVNTGIPQRTLDHVERMELAVSPTDGTVYVALLGDGSALTTAVAAGAANNILTVETPEVYRVGDRLDIGFVPTSKLGTAASRNSDVIELADKNLDIQAGDAVRFKDSRGDIDRNVVSNLGNGRLKLASNPPRNVKKGVRVVALPERVTVRAIVGNRLTIDSNTGMAGNQGVAFNWGAGRIVRNGNKERAVALYQSKDFGGQWNRAPLPNPAGELEDGASQTGLHPGNQANKHFSLVVSPTNSNLIFIGGDRQPDTSSIGDTSKLGRLFAGVIVPPGAPGGTATATWGHLVGNRAKDDQDGNGSLETLTAPHADSRDLVFANDGTLLEADDGGIVSFTPVATLAADVGNVAKNLGEWRSLAGNLGTAEFYGVVYDAFSDTIYGGTQDNGSPLQDATGNEQFTEHKGGDGTLPGWSGNDFRSDRYLTSQNFGISHEFLAGFGGSALAALSVRNAAGNRLRNFDFVQQYAVNQIDGSRILVEHPTGSKEGSLFEMQRNAARTRLNEVRRFTRATLKTTNMNLSAAIYGFAPADDPAGAGQRPDLIYAGFARSGSPRSRGKLFFREAGVNRPIELKKYRTQAKGAGIRDIVVDPFDFKKIIVIDEKGQVWRNNDAPGGEPFKNITGNLKKLARDIRTVEFVNLTGNAGDETLLVGGLRGVYQLQADPFKSGLGTFKWKRFGNKLPRVLVTDIQYAHEDDVLIVGTWGRGVWSIKDFKAKDDVFPAAASAVAAKAFFGPLSADGFSTAGVEPTIPLGFTFQVNGTTENDTVLIQRSDDNSLFVEITVNGQLLEPLDVMGLSRIVFDGLSGNDHLTVDLSNGAIGLPGVIDIEDLIAIEYQGSGGNDTVEVRGGPLMTRASSFDPVSESGIILLGSDDSLGGIKLVDVESVQQDQLPSPMNEPISALGAGLEHLADWSGDLLDALASPIAALDSSWIDVLNGLTVESDGEQLGDVDANAVRKTVGLATSDVLRRIFETGPDAVTFAELGTDITTTNDLVSALQGLGDVTVVQDDANALILDLSIERFLEGDAEIAVEVLSGTVQLEGNVRLSGEVAAKMRFGVDEQGFFLDADAFPDSELTIKNLTVSGEIEAIGKVGFLAVSLEGGTIELASDVAIEVDIQDPGVDPLLGSDDGVVRVYELSDDPSTMASLNLVSSELSDDLVFTVNLSALPLVEDLGPLFNLGDASLELRFPDINDPANATISAAAGLGQDLIEFLNVDVPQFVQGLRDAAETFASFTNLDVLSTRIPLIGKSIGDVLSSVPEPLALSGNAIMQVGATDVVDTDKLFTVTLEDSGVVKKGATAGDAVRYLGENGQTFDGQIAAVDPASITVRFDAVMNQEPERENPELEIFVGGGLGDQLDGLLGTSISTLVEAGSIQDLIEEFANRLGIDLEQFNLQSSGSGADRALTMTLPLDIDPITFSSTLDLSTEIAALELTAQGEFQIEIDPQISLPIGVRIASGVPLEDRVFIVDNDEPEVSLLVTARLDDPVVGASLGFLDLVLQEQNLPTNEGIVLTAMLGVDLDEPVSMDGRITLGELIGGPLLDFVDTSFSANLDIDGLELKARGALADVLGTVQIDLDGTLGGVFHQLQDLTDLPSRLNIQGLDEILNFDNLSALGMQQLLNQLRSWLDELRGSSVFDTDLPFTDKTLGDVIDLGEAFFDAIIGGLGNPRLIADGLSPVDGRLAEDVNLSLSVNDEVDLVLTVLASQTASNTTLDDLVEDVRGSLNFALDSVGLSGLLDVGIRQGSLTIVATSPDIEGIAVTAGDKLLGFAVDQIADEIGFRSIDELIEGLTERLPGPLNATYDSTTNVLSFTLSFDASLDSGELPLEFSAGVGSLAEISTQSNLSVTASADGKLTLGFDLSDLTSGFQLERNTAISILNDGQGVVIPSDIPEQMNDIRATLRSGEVLDIDLLESFTTVGQVLDAISAASPNLTADISEDKHSIRLTDASAGSSLFAVESVSGSFSALDLGLSGTDFQDSGTIVGQPLHGKTNSDRFFIDATDATLGGSLGLSATDIDASARLGFAGVAVENGIATASATARVTLQDPGTDAADGRITFDELFSAISDDVSALVTVQGPTGSANFDLPIQLDPAELTPPGTPRLLVTMTDLFDPATLNATIAPEFDLLKGLENFAFQQLIAGLREVQSLLQGVEGIGLFQQELPLIETSVADLLELSVGFGRVIDQLEIDQPRSIQQLQDSLLSVLQNESGGPTIPSVMVSLADQSFDIDLMFGRGIGKTLPLDFDLIELGGAAGNLISAEVDGELTVSASASFNLGLSVDVSNPTSPRFFIKDTTGISAGATVSGTDLEFDATVLVFDLLIRNGSADLTGNWTIGLDDDPVDGRYDLFNEFSTDLVSSSLIGTANANLPIDFMTVGNPLDASTPAIVLDVDRLADVLTSPGSILQPPILVLPDFAGLVDQLLADLRGNLGGLVDSWDDVFRLLEELVDGEVFGVPIPLIGDQLAQAASFLTELREDVASVIDGLGEQGVQPVLDAFLGVLGPANLNLLDDVNDDGVITTDDISTIATADRVQFDFKLHRDLTLLDQAIDFDIGLPGLGLEVDGDVRTLVGFDFEFGFGFSKTEGVYLDVSKNNELEVDVEASIPGLDARGTLAFLQIDATDDPDDPTSFTGRFTVDVKDPGDQLNDGRLSLTEIRSASPADIISTELTATADVNLPFVTSFAGNAAFPSLQGEFNLDWQFTNADTTEGLEDFGDEPAIAFNNLQLDAGTFLVDLFGSTLGTIQQILGPVAPVIDVLTFQLPILNVSILDLAKRFGDARVDFVAAAVDLVDLVQNIPFTNDAIMVDLGSFDLQGTDVRGQANLNQIIPNALSIGTPKTQLASESPTLSNFLDDAENVSGGGFSFPIWDDPSSAFGLLMGKDVSLIEFDMAPLSLTISKSYEIPIVPPLFAEFTGRAGLSADFEFGFDTVGLRKFVESDFTDFATIADGFYVRDTNDDGEDIDEVLLSAALIGAGAINTGVAKGGIQAGIEAKAALNLDDPNDDGHVRFDELAANFLRHPLAVFDASGQLDVFAGPFLKFGITVPFLGFKTLFEVDLPEFRKTLIRFDFDASSVGNPVLGSMDQGELTLHMGPLAADRVDGDTSDSAEVFQILPGALSDQVIVDAFGFRQQFDGVRRIVGDGGLENDVVTVAAGVSVPVELSGGEGSDQLTAGIGPAILRGGPGKDTLTGGAAADQLFGDGESDQLSGGGGSDLVEGGSGRDMLTGGGGDDTLRGGDGVDTISGGDGADSIEGGDDTDNLSGGDGPDDIDGGLGNDLIEGLSGNDMLVGGPGHDTIFGGQGADTILGAGGNDVVFGDGENDDVSGGAGNDTLEGGPGNDLLAGDDGRDSLVGGEGSDELLGGTDNDYIVAELDETGGSTNSTHTISGGTGNDTIFGSHGADTIDGEDDSDIIFSFNGIDLVNGGSGADTIDAGSGDDVIFGGAGNDEIIAGLGSDQIFGGADNDRIIAGISGAGSENVVNTIEGNDGNDFISGDLGNDIIDAGDGDDTVYALAGDDSMLLGNGNDTAFGGLGQDTILGGAGDDQVSGGAHDDVLVGNEDDDSLSGNGGQDVLWGDSQGLEKSILLASLIAPPRFADAELVHATGYTPPSITPAVLVDHAGLALVSGTLADGLDTLAGGDDSDWLFGGGNVDFLNGGLGSDFVHGGAGNDLTRGGDDDDVVLGGDDDDTTHGDGGIDQVYGDDWFDAGPTHGQDLVFGDAGDAGGIQSGQRLWGGGDADTVSAFSPTDVVADEVLLVGDELHGGDGNDTLYGNLRRERLFGDAGKDDLFGDMLAGSNYANNPEAAVSGASDLLNGGTGEDHLFGGGGSDRLLGGFDSDRLEGQDGHDQLMGGSGIDLLVLDTNFAFGEHGDAIDGHFGNEVEGTRRMTRRISCKSWGPPTTIRFAFSNRTSQSPEHGTHRPTVSQQ